MDVVKGIVRPVEYGGVTKVFFMTKNYNENVLIKNPFLLFSGPKRKKKP
jgi:hypothetical protein